MIIMKAMIVAMTKFNVKVDFPKSIIILCLNVLNRSTFENFDIFLSKYFHNEFLWLLKSFISIFLIYKISPKLRVHLNQNYNGLIFQSRLYFILLFRKSINHFLYFGLKYLKLLISKVVYEVYS